MHLDIGQSNLPKHIALIMDGNGRWAQARGLSRLEGHRQGAHKAQEIVRAAGEIGIQYITLYAFSIENQARPKEEIDGLMELLRTFLSENLSELIDNQVNFRVIGRYQELPQSTVKALEQAIEQTKEFNNQYLVLALNYSSRTEIVDAFKRYQAEGPTKKDLDWDCLKDYLDTQGIPDPDLIIRTSGERRLSNFLLLQGAYSEMLFPEVCWPDFGKELFIEALSAYQKRERRFGKTSDQIKQEFLAGR